MASKIGYQTWDGGEGWNCPTELIGYCIESPIEVLKQVLLTHDVYHYLDLYRPIDYDCPNNVMGLVIDDASKCLPQGMVITGNFNDLDCNIALTEHNRTKETILSSLDKCKKWHSCLTNKLVNDRHIKSINEVEQTINEIL